MIKKWIDSVNNAIEGILYATKTQRHLRYHLYFASAILLLSYIFGVEKTDFLIISVAVILIVLAEMINTAIEYVVDIIFPEHSEKARTAKDVAAGAVLITSFGAAVLGYIVLIPYFKGVFETGFYITKRSGEAVALISIILVLISVIILKVRFGKGHPLRGGIPSGHAAIAFSIWIAVTYITESFISSLLCFALSVLIAQSRVAAKVHSPAEVIVGAALGAGVTLSLFLIFY